MFVDNLLKKVQIECLVAFAHSRISGVAGKGQDGVEVFENRFVLKKVVNTSRSIEDAIKDLATLEYINKKIADNKNIALSNMYHHHYTKALDIMDSLISKDETFIEGLIGLHILILATEKGYLINEDGSSNLEVYKEIASYYENENYTTDEAVNNNIKKMKVIAEKIFNKYWEKPKRISKKRK